MFSSTQITKLIHNAAFDLGFLNAELQRLGRARLSADRVVDTLALARSKFPGAQASLDALCRRFEIDNTMRTLHGALLDCELLAAVYLELKGGRQPGLELAAEKAGAAAARDRAADERPARPPDHRRPGRGRVSGFGSFGAAGAP